MNLFSLKITIQGTMANATQMAKQIIKTQFMNNIQKEDKSNRKKEPKLDKMCGYI